MLIGEIDIDGDLFSVGGQIRQHELRTPEHAEGVTVDASPGQVDKPLTLLALHGWAAEVSVDSADFGEPLDLSRVSRDETGRLAPDLEPDMDVRVCATGQTPRTGGETSTVVSRRFGCTASSWRGVRRQRSGTKL